MHFRVFLFVVGVLLCALAGAQLCVTAVSFYFNDGCGWTLLATALGVGAVGVAAACGIRGARDRHIEHRHGFAVVGLCWVTAACVGALPYIFCLDMPVVDAVFETTSGFTTTGATILTDIEAVPKSLLLWRSVTHWLGGMGIIMLSLAVLPLLGVGGMQLYKAEMPGPTKDKLTPRVRDTAMTLWRVYVLMTVAEILLLWLAGMTPFDAVNHTFATVATGGFSTRNASIAAFPSPAIQWIIIFFMAAAGVNFTLHFHLLHGRIGQYGRDAEFRWYVGILALGAGMAALALYTHGTPLGQGTGEAEPTIRAAVFQIVSICTTTGFITEDYLKWPYLAQMVILLLMFVGGCAGSTGGGIKFMRILLLGRIAYQEIFRLLHPHARRQVKINDRPVPADVLQGVTGFTLAYLAILGVSTFVLAAFNLDVLTAFSASLTCLSNVGPGFAAVGPVENFAHLPAFIKGWLSLCMLLGRLEIYAILLLLIPEFWRN